MSRVNKNRLAYVYITKLDKAGSGTCTLYYGENKITSKSITLTNPGSSSAALSPNPTILDSVNNIKLGSNGNFNWYLQSDKITMRLNSYFTSSNPS